MTLAGWLGQRIEAGCIPARRDVAAGVALVACALGLWLAPPDAVAVLLLAATAGLILASPLAGVCAIVAAVPFVYQTIAVRGAEFSLMELAVVFSCASVGARLAAETVRQRSTRALVGLLKPWRFTVAVGVLVSVAACSLAWVADERYLPESLRAFRLVILEPAAAFFLFRYVRRQGRLGFTLVVATATATCVALTAIVQFSVDWDVVVVDGLRRATGPYPHPNNLALYLERLAVFVLCFTLAARAQLRLLGVLTAVLLLGVLATLSRGAILGVIVGSAWAWNVLRPARRGLWIGIGAVIALTGVAVLAGDRLLDTGGTGSTSSRALIWTSSVRMLRDRPLEGVGLDQFLYQYGRRYVDPAGWPERYTSHPHNLVLDSWLTLGAVGLVILAAIVAASVWSLRHPAKLAPFTVAGGAALLTGLTHGMLDNGFFLPDLAVLTWLMIAVIEPAPGAGGPARASA